MIAEFSLDVGQKIPKDLSARALAGMGTVAAWGEAIQHRQLAPDLITAV